jgi:AraC family transcriptional regulator, transcriptional activator of pobA
MTTINSTTAATLAFEINSIQWLKENMRLLDKPQRHFSAQIIWIMNGRGHYCIDTERYALADNTIYFVPSGRVQQLHARGDLTGYILSFSSDLFLLAIASPCQPVSDELIAGFSRVNVVSVRDKKTENVLTNFLEEMMQELAEHRLLHSEVLAGLLKVFLIYLRRMSLPLKQEISSSKTITLFNAFNSTLDKSILTRRSVADYASDLSVTPSYLTEVVKRFTGLSASQHIQQRKVLEAKRLAIYSGDNMKSIAYKLGFDDVSHFSKFFKNATGINFSDFKKKRDADHPKGSVVGRLDDHSQGLIPG